VDVQFVASVAPIVRDVETARAFYGNALGLSFEGGEGDYVFTQRLDGTKHFGLWPLAEAATACFGTRSGQVRFRFLRPALSSKSQTSPPPRLNSKARATGPSTTPAPNPGRRLPPAC